MHTLSGWVMGSEILANILVSNFFSHEIKKSIICMWKTCKIILVKFSEMEINLGN